MRQTLDKGFYFTYRNSLHSKKTEFQWKQGTRYSRDDIYLLVIDWKRTQAKFDNHAILKNTCHNLKRDFSRAEKSSQVQGLSIS